MCGLCNWTWKSRLIAVKKWQATLMKGEWKRVKWMTISFKVIELMAVAIEMCWVADVSCASCSPFSYWRIEWADWSSLTIKSETYLAVTDWSEPLTGGLSAKPSLRTWQIINYYWHVPLNFNYIKNNFYEMGEPDGWVVSASNWHDGGHEFDSNQFNLIKIFILNNIINFF